VDAALERRWQHALAVSARTGVSAVALIAAHQRWINHHSAAPPTCEMIIEICEQLVADFGVSALFSDDYRN
jgi:hypothetical protein